MIATFAKIVVPRRQAIARVCLTIAALNFAIVPAYSLVADGLNRLDAASIAVSAVSPGAHNVNNDGGYTRVDESEDSEKRLGLRGDRQPTANPVPPLDLDTTAPQGRVAALVRYFTGSQFVEVRSRVVTAAVYLCLAQRFP